MTREKSYWICCPMCDNEKCVKDAEECDAYKMMRESEEQGMTREEILDGLYEIKNWKCNGDVKTHEVVAEAIKALEQESILDNIRAEIAKLPDLNPDYEMDKTIHVSKWAVFDIIDKYRKAEE